jgi:hypothetical protein
VIRKRFGDFCKYKAPSRGNGEDNVVLSKNVTRSVVFMREEIFACDTHRLLLIKSSHHFCCSKFETYQGGHQHRLSLECSGLLVISMLLFHSWSCKCIFNSFPGIGFIG